MKTDKKQKKTNDSTPHKFSSPKEAESPKYMFSSRDEQIDYMFGDDPILCQALKNCED